MIIPGGSYSGNSPTRVRPLNAPPFASAAANVPEISPLESDATSKRATTFVSFRFHGSSAVFVTPPTVNEALPAAPPFAE